MKIKITLLSLFFTHIMIHPIYADSNQEQFTLESDQLDHMLDKNVSQETEDKEESSEQFIQLNGELAMSPSWIIQHDEGNHQLKNDIKALLKLKAEVPSAWTDQKPKVNIKVALDKEKVSLGQATATFLDVMTVGYDDTILCYKKSNPALPISIQGEVLHLKFEQSFDWFNKWFF